MIYQYRYYPLNLMEAIHFVNAIMFKLSDMYFDLLGKLKSILGTRTRVNTKLLSKDQG